MKFLCDRRLLLFTFIAFLVVCNIAVAEPAIDADYERELLVESGWLKYITISVKNVGEGILNNVMISFENGHPDWFEVVTNKTNIIEDYSKNFTVKLNIPAEVEVGEYPFTLVLKSSETVETKPLLLLVFSSKSEMLLHQLTELQKKISELKNDVNIADSGGKDVDDIRVSLEGAEIIIGTAEKYVTNELFNDAVDKIKNVEYLITEAEYELSIAEERAGGATEEQEVDWSLVIIIAIATIVIFISFKNKKLRGKRIGRVLKRPDFRIKEIIKKRLGKDSIDKQIVDLNKSQQLLDEEYKQKILSKQSYDELTSLNQKKILELQQKKKK